MELTTAVAEFAGYLAADRGFSAHTVKSYRSDLEQLAAFANARAATSPTDVDLELLRDWLWRASQDGLSKATLARRAAAARALTAWFARSGMTPADAGIRLKAPKTDHHLPRVLTREQVDGILESVQLRADTGDAVAVRDLAIIELLYASALRVSELTGLAVRDVDLGRLTVRVLGKGSKERVVPVRRAGQNRPRALPDRPPGTSSRATPTPCSSARAAAG